MTFSVSYTLQRSLWPQNAWSLLSLLCLHQSLPGEGSQQCPLLPCSHSYRLATVSQLTQYSSCRLPESESEPYITTDVQSASLSWKKAPIWGLRSDFYYCQTVAGLLMWSALSDERTGLSFTIASCIASAVIYGFESRGTRDHILLSQIRDIPFRRLLRLAGLRWRYSNSPSHGTIDFQQTVPLITYRHGLFTKSTIGWLSVEHTRITYRLLMNNVTLRTIVRQRLSRNIPEVSSQQ
jgi:hypothetical protein